MQTTAQSAMLQCHVALQQTDKMFVCLPQQFLHVVLDSLFLTLDLQQVYEVPFHGIALQATLQTVTVDCLTAQPKP